MEAEALLILQMIKKLECSISCSSNDSIHLGSVEYRREMKTEVIDELNSVVDILREKKLGEGSDRLNYFISDLLHMANEALDETYIYDFDSILCWMGEIKIRMLKLGVDGAETKSNMISDDDVVGLEEDVQQLLLTEILNDKINLSSLLIKGMIGVGKTTLARQLYNHAAVVDAFECRAWVCVSTDLTIKEVLIKLIQQVADSKKLHSHMSSLLEGADIPALQRMLRKHLRRMRYLIVLDDVPKHMCLQTILKPLLHDYGKRSRLLLTSYATRRDVNTINFSVHRMESLDSNKSWELFLKTIFHDNKFTSEQEFPKHLEKRGKEMLRKCDGLPLAIKEVGRQLAEKRRSGSEWEQLLESIDFDSTVELLKPFYDRMDPQLKSCFLHLAFFKENITLREEKLNQIWLAGGVVYKFIDDKCLSDLINESVIELKGKRGRYRMNAMLRRLSIKKAEEEIGFEILSSNGNNRPSQNPRHRVMNCSRDEFNYSTNQDKHLVSLFFHGGGYLDVSPSYWRSFEQLEILDFEDFGLKILPDSIGTLWKLRYLGLRNNYIEELPDSLGCLKNLEVLDIALNFMVVVPDIIWEMRSLCHLYMSDVICREPLKIDAGMQLSTLSISVDNWTGGVGGWKLHKLGIEEVDGNSDVSKLFASLEELPSLQYLILRGFRFRSMPCLDELRFLHGLTKLKLDGLLAKLPSANNFPPKLKQLKLVNSCLDEDPMPVLEKLPYLEDLKLRNAYRGRHMVILEGGFRWLICLCIEELWNLRNVQATEGALLLLEKVEIHNCPYLETIPSRMSRVKNLSVPKKLSKLVNRW